MKTTLLRLMIATTMIIGTVYTVSFILTQEMTAISMLLIAFAIVKFIVRTTLYIVFRVAKWVVVIAVIGLLLASLF